MRILLSNDDGVYAEGLKVLQDELSKIAKVWVVAPLEEKSTAGHSLTLHKPLRIHTFDKFFYGTTGSPADCIHIGIQEIMKVKPDLVVSGINRGANLGQDCYYSGTISAAREACIMGFPALAVSLCLDVLHPPAEKKLHYETAAKIAREIIKKMDTFSLPRGTLLNLNVPDVPFAQVKGVRTARQGFRRYSSSLVRRKDHRGKKYFWVGGRYLGFKKEPQTDCITVEKKYASITPLKLDSTDANVVKVLNQHWPMEEING